MIKTQVIGSLGKDAEFKVLESGQQVANFSVAHSEKYTTAQGEKKESTVWVDVALWGKLAEKLVPYLTKGTKVYVEGTPSARGYQAGDGKIGASLQLKAFSVELLGSSNRGEQTPAPAQEGFAGQPADTINDLPF